MFNVDAMTTYVCIYINNQKNSECRAYQHVLYSPFQFEFMMSHLLIAETAVQGCTKHKI